MLTAEQVIRLLRLAPHPEGGWYRETYRAAERLDAVLRALLPVDARESPP